MTTFILPTEPERHSPWTYFQPGAWPEAFTVEECTELRKIAAALEPTLPTVALVDADGESRYGVDPSIRSVEQHIVVRTEESVPFMERILHAARGANHAWWGFDVTHLGVVEVLHYAESDGYIWHVDIAPGHQCRKLSVIVQLSDPDEYVGGDVELRVGSEPVKMPKEQGTIIVFPSYVLHRVLPVTEGDRWSAVAWVEGPPFR